MVGVPGRSTGCVTCRARGVKCDENKPTCQNCHKSKYVCGGYKKTISFIDQTSKLEASFRARDKSTKYARRQPAAKLLRAKEAEQPHEALVQTSSPPSIMEVDLTAFKQEICISYLFKALLNSEYTAFQTILWRSSFKSPNDTALAPTALQSLALTYFAQMHNNSEALLDEASTLHAQALGRLRDKVRHPNTSADQDLMFGVLGLYLLELVLYSSDTAWLWHLGGLTMLVERAGPSVFRFQPLHDYFLFCRQRLIARALVARKRVFLERPEWQAIPWQFLPETKTALQRLLDIEAKIPGLYESVETFCGTVPAARVKPLDPARNVALYESISADLGQYFKDLVHWRHTWELDNANLVHEVSELPTSRCTENLARPRSLHNIFYFQSPELAKEIVLYNVCWCAFLWMADLIEDISYDGIASKEWPISERPRKQNPLCLPLDAPLDTDSMFVGIHEMMKCIDYCLLDHHPYRLDIVSLLAGALRAW